MALPTRALPPYYLTSPHSCLESCQPLLHHCGQILPARLQHLRAHTQTAVKTSNLSTETEQRCSILLLWPHRTAICRAPRAARLRFPAPSTAPSPTHRPASPWQSSTRQHRKRDTEKTKDLVGSWVAKGERKRTLARNASALSISRCDACSRPYNNANKKLHGR